MRTATVTLAVAAAVGLALRVTALTGPLGALDGDEAVWGLMALHVLDGEIQTFFWAQEYGGSHEVLLTAPFVALLGPTPLAIRIVPIALYALAVWLVLLIGRRTIGEPAATYAAALACVWPAYGVWKSTRAHGFYGSGLVLALLALLLILRLRNRASHRDYALLGLVCGLGLWATPQVGLVVIPGLAWLVVRRPAALRGAPLALAAAALGALPWILWNLEHDWGSFDRAVASEAGRYDDRLRGFASALLPTALGLRTPFTLEWIPGAAAGWLLVGGVLSAGAFLALRRRHQVEPLLVIALAFPFLFALSPFAWYVEEPRYLVLLLPVLALLGARIVGSARTGPALVAACAILTVAGLTQMRDGYRVTADGREVPRDRGPLLDLLEQERVRHAVADYHLAYPVTFETGERIVAVPLGQPRYPAHRREVDADRRRAYVTVAGSSRDTVWRRQLRERERVVVGGFAAYLPRQ